MVERIRTSGSRPGVRPLRARVGESELRDGHDVAIVAVGRMVENARKACESLSKQGIEARLVNARFVVPLDIECLRRAAVDCGRIVTVEENVLAGGFGSAVAETLVSEKIGAVLDCIGVPNEFIEHGDVARLWEATGLAPEAIAQRVAALVRSNPGAPPAESAIPVAKHLAPEVSS